MVPRTGRFPGIFGEHELHIKYVDLEKEGLFLCQVDI